MTISLTHIILRANHGVFPNERERGNNFRVSVQVSLPDVPAITTDQLPDTINYQVIYDTVVHEMAIPSNLLEHVAGRIANAILRVIPCAQHVVVTIEKQNPPLGGTVEWAGVTIEI